MDRDVTALDAAPTVPDGLELRHLRALVAVAEELNFRRAAERLFVSAPALSRTIAALERMVGCVLVHRSTHGVAMSLAGQAMYDRTAVLLADLGDLVRETRAIGGELAARILALGEPFAALTFNDVDELRATAERHYAQLPIAPGVTFCPVTAGGVPALDARPARPGTKRILLVHGGNYVNGSAYGFRSLAGALAEATGSSVLTPDYRLAPEHCFPAAVDDIDATLAWLAAQGTPPSTVTLIGDASGAGLAMSLLLRLKAQGRPMPGRCVLFTPWVDVRLAAADRLPDVPQSSSTRAGMALGIAHYLAGTPVDHPLMDPLNADLAGLPPMLVQAGTDDEGLDDAQRLTDRARQHGVDVRLEIYPVAAESFQLYWSFLPEAADALRQVAAFHG